ncbi:MAG TPA: hypothetical protein VFW08_08945 [bacterium]|nr:hypothetical protein [bacterium]
MGRIGVSLRLAAALTALLLARSAIGAPAPPSSIRIEAVSVSVHNPLGPGDRLPVSLRATGGGSATFHIFGIASDIGMRELRAAGYQGLTTQYAGTYQVRQGDGMRNAAVFATLTGRGAQAMAPADRGLTIDARVPRLTARLPAPAARVTNARPNIAIEMIDLESGIDPRSVRLIINGQNVTARASISDILVTYNPADPFAPGHVRVELLAADRAGNPVRQNWTFEVVRNTGLLSSVTINPSTVLTEDDLLTVVAAGVSEGRASFALKGIRGERPMKESGTKGIYFGTLVVPQGMAVTGGALVVTLEKDGRSSTMAAAVPVTILAGGQPQASTIAARGPAGPIDDPEARLELNGTSRPGYRIIGRIDYAVRSASLDQTGMLGEFTVLAASNGTWRASFSPLVPLGDARLTVTVIAVDPAGRRSPPARIEVNGS